MGTCALCKTKNVEIKSSHIIPKLVYTRVKTFRNSRFRNHNNLNQIFQDGEKKPMLCANCERFFCSFETQFANKFLDKQPRKKFIHKKTVLEYKDYIVSVAWRVLYDDLFICGSHDDLTRKTWETLEQKLFCFLDDKRLGKDNVYLDSQIKNYIFPLSSLGYPNTNDIINKFYYSIIGYSVYTNDFRIFMVFTAYLGYVITTVFIPKKDLEVDNRQLILFLGNCMTKKGVRRFITDEIDWNLETIATQAVKNEDVYEKGLRQKILNRYKNQPRIHK